jgi:hypothetical protein
MSIRLLLVIAPLALAVLPLGAQRPPEKPHPALTNQGVNQADPIRDLAQRLIAGGVANASRLEPERQGFLLTLAGDALAPTDMKEAMAHWREAFEVTEGMVLTDPAGARAGTQEGLVLRFANYDPVIGLEFLEEMDRPQWTNYPNQDNRKRAIKLIVDKLLQRDQPGDLDKVQEALRYAGDTGEYAYSAAADVVDFFHERGESARIQQVFSEALGYTAKDERFGETPDDFAELILASEGKVSADLLARAIRSAIASARVREEREKENGAAPKRTISLVSGDERLDMSHVSTYISLKLLPLARRLNPDLANELVEQDPQLQRVARTTGSENLGRWEGAQPVFIGGAVTPQRLHEIQEDVEAGQALRKVEQAASSDPLTALSDANKIQPISIRVRALAAAAGVLAKSDPGKARSALEEAGSLADKIQEPVQKIAALFRIANGWGRVGDVRSASKTISTAFGLGISEYERQGDNAEGMAHLVSPPTSWLARLMRLEADLDPRTASGLADRISDPALQGYMELTAAREILLTSRGSKELEGGRR